MQGIVMNRNGDAVGIVTVNEKARGAFVNIEVLRVKLSGGRLSNADLNDPESKELVLVQCENQGVVKSPTTNRHFLMLRLPDEQSEKIFMQPLDGVAIEKMKREAWFSGYLAGLKKAGAVAPQEADASQS